MYDYIKGILVNKNTIEKICITIECNNIGYLINSNLRIINLLPQIGENIKLYISLIHKEDSMSMCGFLQKEDRDIFNILQSVSGVGMKSALTLLDNFSGCELITLVINEDVKSISQAKGVGPKLAKKIILELKDKLLNRQQISPILLNEINPNIENNISDEFLLETHSVLLSLGYTDKEIKEAVKYSLNKIDIEKIKTSEELLRISLQYLAQQY